MLFKPYFKKFLNDCHVKKKKANSLVKVKTGTAGARVALASKHMMGDPHLGGVVREARGGWGALRQLPKTDSPLFPPFFT